MNDIRFRERTSWLRPVSALSTGLVLVACSSQPSAPAQQSTEALLGARPSAVTEPLPAGMHALALSVGRDGFLYIPEGLEAGPAVPLVVLLHGATGRARNWEAALPLADSAGVVLLAPDARGLTWDAIRGQYSHDVAFIDSALEKTFRSVSIDPTRIAFGGFSDGASYALGLGLANGELVTHVLAFSPGFVPPAPPVGRPRIYVSHGTTDAILPIDRTSRLIVPALRGAGYEVQYEEFEGPHELPREIAEDGLSWFLGS